MGGWSLEVEEDRKPSPLESKSKVSEQLRGGRAGGMVHKGAGAGLRTGRFNGQSDLWRSKELQCCNCSGMTKARPQRGRT
jgi:hypothetical protein